MKQLTILGVIALIGCTKYAPIEDLDLRRRSVSKPSCNVISLSQRIDTFTNDYVNRVVYDDANKSITYHLDTARSYTWQYPGSITIEGNSGDQWHQKIITINAKGMLMGFTTDFGMTKLTDTISYQNENQVIRTLYRNFSNPPVLYNYTWKNGNIESKTYDGHTMSKNSYSYSIDPSSIGDYFTYLNITLYQGFRVFASKNLPIGNKYSDVSQITGSETYTYMPANNNVAQMRANSTLGPSYKVYYAYTCK